MAEALIGAAVSAAFNEFYAVVKNAVSLVVWCDRYCQELQDDLEKHQPFLEQICSNLSTPPSAWEERFLGDFSQKLKEGRVLVDSCVQRRPGWANFFCRLRYSRKLLKLREDILQLLQQLPCLHTLHQLKLREDIQAVREEQGRNNSEVISALRALRLNSGTASADVINNQSDQTRLVDAGMIQEDLIGLDSHIEQVTSLLKDKEVVILNGMGGIGKTTLALAICNDDKVKHIFKGGVHFFVVSQSPDMKGLLSTIWKQVLNEEQAPFFQTEEDAHRQLTTKLRSFMSSQQGHDILLVLDDVWSHVALEKLSFGVTGLKTMITTREAANLHARHSHTYNLSLLNETGAKSLFSYCAFGEYSIPDWIEEPLRPVVHEVIKECQGLPLALKVIGTSLLSTRDNPPALEYWCLTRDRLQKAGPLGQYHKDALFGRLQTSVDALDDFLQECFIDLAVFPEDAFCSADILLDIWVYVRGQDWEEAVLALAELGNRCLLTFKNGNITRADIGRAVKWKSASELVFTQHDVLRDLAVQLAVKDESKSRLLMPAMNNILSNSRQPENSVVGAKVISIHTGPNFLNQVDRLAASAFPHAEALLLDVTQTLEEFWGGIRLPSLISRMGPTLKVLFIRVNILYIERWSVKPKDGLLTDFNELRSLDLQNGVQIISPRLEKLRLNHSSIQELPADFAWLLTSLEILSCHRLRKLPQDFGRLQNLRRLVIGVCPRIKWLPDSFGELGCLQHLSLKECMGLQCLPESFGQLGCLQHLNLEWCVRLQCLPESFGQLGCLQHLNLEWCVCLQCLPESFGQLGCLQHLSLRECRGLQCLPESFGQLGCLQHLSLANCWCLQCLPESFGQLGCLQHLSLANCSCLQCLPESFGQLGCLQHLNIACCNRLEYLSKSFGQLKELRTLDMRLVMCIDMGDKLSKSLTGAVRPLIGSLERVHCHSSLLPVWMALFPAGHPLPLFNPPS